MFKFNPTTPFAAWFESSTYVPGQGNTTTWEQIKSGDIGVYFCEWRGSFGEQQLAAHSLGVNEMATIRTFYNPDIYAALQGKKCVIVKYADASSMVGGKPSKNSPYLYELWGGVDNVLEQNLWMEFKVRRYEGK